MDYLPIFLDLKGKPCALIGGGEVAARKVRLLLKAGAQGDCLCPGAWETLAGLVREGKIEHRKAVFEPSLLDDCVLAIAATDDKAVNRAVYEAAKARRIPVNVVDQPELCTFIMPSIIDRSPVIAAVSTGGASPVLARLIRARLETLIPAAYGRLAKLVAEFRETVKQRFQHPEARRRFWEDVLQGPIAERMLSGQEDAAREALVKRLETAAGGSKPLGEVYLVGGGPGDPDLLTFRALRLMQQADVVVYDRLVSPEVLELVRRDADRIYAGKERDNHAIPQEDINQLLVRLAKEGKRVVRLKGGDPFIFGRGGEEIATLMEEGIPFQVVPGHHRRRRLRLLRRYSADAPRLCPVGGVRHRSPPGTGAVNLNWKAIAQPKQTIVFYMGLHGVADICRELIAHGLPATTPMALVQQGTTRHQRVITGTLATLPGILGADEDQAADVDYRRRGGETTREARLVPAGCCELKGTAQGDFDMNITKIAVLPVILLAFLTLGGVQTVVPETTITGFQKVSSFENKKVHLSLPVVVEKDMETKKNPDATEKVVADELYTKLKEGLNQKGLLAGDKSAPLKLGFASALCQSCVC